MRNIFIVNATQVVVSESNPQGAYSVVQGYPKTFDSRNYNATEQNPNGDEARALEVAEADFFKQVGAFKEANNRVMWAVTLTRADGRQIRFDHKGAFPDMTPPAPEPEPEPEEQGEQ